MTRSFRRLAGLLVLAILGGCIAKPDRDEKGVMASAKKVLALDFGTHASGSHQARLTSLPSIFESELTRASTSLGMNHENSIGAALGSEVRRVGSIGVSAKQLFGAELTRYPHKVDGVLPSSFEFEQNTANGFETALWLLSPSRHALGEISDYEHRTDHDDKRPEATFWQRLKRRLSF